MESEVQNDSPGNPCCRSHHPQRKFLKICTTQSTDFYQYLGKQTALREYNTLHSNLTLKPIKSILSVYIGVQFQPIGLLATRLIIYNHISHMQQFGNYTTVWSLVHLLTRQNIPLLNTGLFVRKLMEETFMQK